MVLWPVVLIRLIVSREAIRAVTKNPCEYVQALIKYIKFQLPAQIVVALAMYLSDSPASSKEGQVLLKHGMTQAAHDSKELGRSLPVTAIGQASERASVHQIPTLRAGLESTTGQRCLSRSAMAGSAPTSKRSFAPMSLACDSTVSTWSIRSKVGSASTSRNANG